MKLDGLQACYRALDLEPGATPQEVRQAYRILVKVWHPDRFGGDPALRVKAEERLKQVNLAYEAICNSGATGTSGPTSPNSSSGSRQNSSPSPNGPSQRPEPRHKRRRTNQNPNDTNQSASDDASNQAAKKTRWPQAVTGVVLLMSIFLVYPEVARIPLRAVGLEGLVAIGLLLALAVWVRRA